MRPAKFRRQSRRFSARVHDEQSQADATAIGPPTHCCHPQEKTLQWRKSEFHQFVVRGLIRRASQRIFWQATVSHNTRRRDSIPCSVAVTDCRETARQSTAKTCRFRRKRSGGVHIRLFCPHRFAPFEKRRNSFCRLRVVPSRHEAIDRQFHQFAVNAQPQ